MSPVFVIFCIIAFVIPVALCIIYKNKIESMETDLGILKKRNETLEERFANEDAQVNAAIEAAPQTGVVFLQQFAESHQIQLEKADAYEDEELELYRFRYQGGYFHCFVSKETDEVLLRYYHFFEIPYSKDAEVEVLRLCDVVTSGRRYAKLTYSMDKECTRILLDLYFDMIGIPQAGFAHLLNSAFVLDRDVSEIAEKICKDLYGERYAEAKPITEDGKILDFHEAVKMVSQENN